MLAAIDSIHVTIANQDQSAHPSDYSLYYLLFSHLAYIILKFSLKMMYGFVHIERWTSPFQIFRVVRLSFEIFPINVEWFYPD
jgi:hypothetical protein